MIFFADIDRSAAHVVVHNQLSPVFDGVNRKRTCKRKEIEYSGSIEHGAQVFPNMSHIEKEPDVLILERLDLVLETMFQRR